MQLIMLPDSCQWLNCGDAAIYLYEKTFEEARYEPFAVVHSSGSTGMPRKLRSIDRLY